MVVVASSRGSVLVGESVNSGVWVVGCVWSLNLSSHRGRSNHDEEEDEEEDHHGIHHHHRVEEGDRSDGRRSLSRG